MVMNMGEMHPDMPRPLADFERAEAARKKKEKKMVALADDHTPDEYAELPKAKKRK